MIVVPGLAVVGDDALVLVVGRLALFFVLPGFSAFFEFLACFATDPAYSTSRGDSSRRGS